MDYRIQVILQVIEERGFIVSLTTQEASQLLGLSEGRVRRLFVRETGTSFAQYLKKRKLAHATELLEDFTVPIKQIALKCGYDDLSNFYRDFRQSYGTTPAKSRLRRQQAES